MARITPVVACSMKTVSSDEPSVCSQDVSPGTLRKRNDLDEADETGALLDPLERRIDHEFLGGRACARHRLALRAGRRVEVREHPGERLAGPLS